MSFNCEATETIMFTQESYDGVLKTFTINREGITLVEVAEVFTDFLVACGYDYVTSVNISTDDVYTHEYNKEAW